MKPQTTSGWITSTKTVWRKMDEWLIHGNLGQKFNRASYAFARPFVSRRYNNALGA